MARLKAIMIVGVMVALAVGCRTAAEKRKASWPDQEQAGKDFSTLCNIHDKTEPANNRKKRPVTPEERKLLLKTLDRRTGAWYAHDFRRMAAITLGNLKAGEAIPKLLSLLKDKNEEHMVSAEAAAALGKIGDKGALPHLVVALRDNRTLVRQYAGKAITALSPGPQEKATVSRGVDFRALLYALRRIELPKTEQQWAFQTNNRQQSRTVLYNAFELEAISTGLVLFDSRKLKRRNRQYAEKLAKNILDTSFPVNAWYLESCPNLCRFLRAYQPRAYAESARKWAEKESKRK